MSQFPYSENDTVEQDVPVQIIVCPVGYAGNTITLPEETAKAILSIWAANLFCTDAKKLIGVLQDKLRLQESVDDAINTAQHWVFEMQLVKAAANQNFSQFPTKLQ